MDHRQNNFDALRLAAALCVLWSHTAPLTQGSEKNELMFRLSQGQTTVGTMAVFAFFAMSGYLITRSFQRTASPSQYVRARLLRIMPGLLAVLSLTALVIGPLESSLSAQAYFRSAAPYRYLAEQSTFFFGWCNALPGVWLHNPMAGVNGAIWTLKYEAEFYGLVLGLGVLGLLRRDVVLVLYLSALAVLALHPGAPGTSDTLPDPNAHLDLGAAFLAGALIQLWNVPLRGVPALLCLLATVCACWQGQMLIAQRTFLPYLILYAALGVPPLLRGTLALRNDISYGVYLWAWPMSQLVVAHLRVDWLMLGLIATPLSVACGWASWHFLEQPALRIKFSAARVAKGALCAVMMLAACRPASVERRTAEVPYTAANPILYSNDHPEDVHTDAIVMALHSNGTIALRGMITDQQTSAPSDCQGDGCHTASIDGSLREQWVEAARASGFRSVPVPIAGEDAVALIVAEAHAASAEVPLVIVVGGLLTSVAQAYERDPSIARTTIVSIAAFQSNPGTQNVYRAETNITGDIAAARTVLQHMRCVIFPFADFNAQHLDEQRYPATPVTRVAALPDTPLRARMLSIYNYPWAHYDADGGPIAALLSPAYASEAHRIRWASDEYGPYLESDPHSDDLLVTSLDGRAATERWWQELERAFSKR